MEKIIKLCAIFSGGNLKNRLTVKEGKIEKNRLGERFRGRDKIKINNPCEVGSSFQWIS